MRALPGGCDEVRGTKDQHHPTGSQQARCRNMLNPNERRPELLDQHLLLPQDGLDDESYLLITGPHDYARLLPSRFRLLSPLGHSEQFTQPGEVQRMAVPADRLTSLHRRHILRRNTDSSLDRLCGKEKRLSARLDQETAEGGNARRKHHPYRRSCPRLRLYLDPPPQTFYPLLHDGQTKAVTGETGNHGAGAQTGSKDKIQGVIVRLRVRIVSRPQTGPDGGCLDPGRINTPPIVLHADFNTPPLQGGHAYGDLSPGRLARLHPGLRRLDRSEEHTSELQSP